MVSRHSVNESFRALNEAIHSAVMVNGKNGCSAVRLANLYF